MMEVRYRISRDLALVVLFLTSTHGLVQSAATTSASGEACVGCPPDQCFAGKCLFAGDDLDDGPVALMNNKFDAVTKKAPAAPEPALQKPHPAAASAGPSATSAITDVVMFSQGMQDRPRLQQAPPSADVNAQLQRLAAAQSRLTAMKESHVTPDAGAMLRANGPDGAAMAGAMLRANGPDLLQAQERLAALAKQQVPAPLVKPLSPVVSPSSGTPLLITSLLTSSPSSANLAAVPTVVPPLSANHIVASPPAAASLTALPQVAPLLTPSMPRAAPLLVNSGTGTPLQAPLAPLTPLAMRQPPYVPVQHSSGQQLSKTDAAYLAGEVGWMQQQIAAKEMSEAKLRNQNALLKQELDGWRTTGTTVMKREAEVVRLIQEKHNGTATAATAVVAEPHAEASFLAQTVKRYVFNSGEAPLGTTAAYLRQLVIIVFFGLILYAFWKHQETVKSSVNIAMSKTKMDKAIAYGRRINWLQPFHPMLRSAGIGSYVVEISEIQIANLLVGGDVYVHVHQPSSHEQMRTKPIQPVITSIDHGSLLKYTESFVINVRKYDDPLVITVVDRDPMMEESIARVEIPTQELLSCAAQTREFFRFNLKTKAQRTLKCPQPEPDEENTSNEPYAAMRLRDFTIQEQAKTIGDTGAGYGSFCTPANNKSWLAV
eukprot:gnl/TRDRNA2_/TRDRNA2_178603_c0_seq1.p1 gnl/TRDRNA2_/TRDRNA2_178603_c0~~gnl/TRDRNA2_/TRDRNA2_178603_c0_seq1.p1  ORF type:complete len:658 (+),score=153.72 gnl/TRDRNA2_/TRDRNA2_178603_c0_seq1:48-2021(+)